MKQIFVLALAALSFASCQNASKTNTASIKTTDSLAGAVPEAAVVPAANAAVIKFEEDKYDFGKIKQGEKVTYSYKFKNVGKSPLIISNATASCGCTIPEVPKDPIKPGGEGVIKVVFNSQGKSGVQDKVITVSSNAQPNNATLHLTGEIKEQSN
jgi:hypothetical protein